MKRITVLTLAIICIACIALVGCTETQNNLTVGTPTSVMTTAPQRSETNMPESNVPETTPETTEPEKTVDITSEPTKIIKKEVNIDWFIYETLGELFDSRLNEYGNPVGGQVTMVFEGTLKDVSFDPQPYSPDDEGICILLRTNYEIEVTKVYMGEVPDICTIGCWEGYQGYKEDIQFEILGENFLERYEPQLVHQGNMWQPQIGGTYLFVARLNQETGKYEAPNPNQIAYKIDPKEKFPQGGVKKSTRPSYITITEYVTLLEYLEKGVISSIPE